MSCQALLREDTTAEQRAPTSSHQLPLFLQLSDISPIGRDASVSSFSSATLTPSSTCPSLVESRSSSLDQK